MRTLPAIAFASLLVTIAPRASLAGGIPLEGEIAILESQLEQGVKALAAGDCTKACFALGGMERAADHICAMEPGPRCDAARAKVKDASRRVRQACPECVEKREEAPPPVRAGVGRALDDKAPSPVTPPPPPAPPAAPEPAPTVPAGAESVSPASPASPGEVSKRGGCAGCAVSGDDASRGAWALAAALLSSCLWRRRSRRGRR